MSTATLHIEKNKALTPHLRFQEFVESWKETLLNDVAEFRKGKGISKSDIIDDGNLECIRYGELYTTYNELIVDIVSKTNLPLKGLELSEYNDVIIPASGETQLDIATASCVLKSGVALSGDLNIIRSSLNGIFLSFYLNNKKKLEIAKLAQGSSVVHLYSSQLKSLKLNIPALPEQQKIASFLSAVDEKIQQLSRKKELLEQYKKGVMQQLFSGKLRFKDENEKDYADWNYKKITDISKTSIGLVTTMTTSYVEIGIPLIRNSDIKENRINKNKLIYLDVDFATKHKHKKFLLGDIVTVHTGEVGVSAVIDDSLVGSLGFATLNTKVNKKIALPEFVCLYYNTIAYINYAVSMSTGDGRSNYNLKDFDKAVIPIPSLDEQKKIAEFINAIYDKIESTSQQITQTKSFKKGLLQQLFV